ncbi:MAG: transporter related protein [Verrucomicrobia bacterium]|nr:transporter related protein [Verrucomicrobiota bacterium]
MTTPPTPLIELVDVRKTYRMGDEDVHALAGVTLSIAKGEFVAVVGPSGSGKSTLMHLLGFMDRPTSGRLIFDQEDVSQLSSSAQATHRARKLGFVFQSFNLLPRLSVTDNILLPLSYARDGRKNGARRAAEVLDRVGLSHRARHRPNQLSGGERQRAAIARALVNSPQLILADEPTGNLDDQNVERVLELFRELHAEGQTIVLVTHDVNVAATASRQIRMQNGRVVPPA